MRATSVMVVVLALLAGCKPPDGRAPAQVQPERKIPPARVVQPALVLQGSFTDGTPLTLDALKGRPWVVNVWLPG